MTTVSAVEWITPALTVAVRDGVIVMRRRTVPITVATLTVTAIVACSPVDVLMSAEGVVDEMIMATGKPRLT